MIKKLRMIRVRLFKNVYVLLYYIVTFQTQIKKEVKYIIHEHDRKQLTMNKTNLQTKGLCLFDGEVPAATSWAKYEVTAVSSCTNMFILLGLNWTSVYYNSQIWLAKLKFSIEGNLSKQRRLLVK